MVLLTLKDFLLDSPIDLLISREVKGGISESLVDPQSSFVRLSESLVDPQSSYAGLSDGLVDPLSSLVGLFDGLVDPQSSLVGLSHV